MKKALGRCLGVLSAASVVFNAACAAGPVRLDQSGQPTYGSGDGTYYSYSGGGNCSYPVPTDIPTAAMNATDYAGSQACGGIVKVTNPANGLSVTVRIDDQCPECLPGDIDLDQQAFAQISALSAGRIPIRWKYIPNQTDSFKLYFKEGSSQYWTAVQVRDMRYPIAALAYRPTGSSAAYLDVPREPYNYFVQSTGMGPGPYDFRITDFWGQIIEVGNVSLKLTTEIDTALQFPLHRGGTTSVTQSTRLRTH